MVLYVTCFILLLLLVGLLLANRRRGDDLSTAIRTGQIASFTAIIQDRPEELHRCSPSGELPLHQAANYGELRAIRLIVRLGGDVNARTPEGMTPLHLAAATGKIDVVRTLLQLGADPDPVNACGLTPLRIAQAHRHRQIEAELIAAGATPPTADGPTPHQTDPLLLDARRCARDSRETLRSLFHRHPTATMVKVPFTTDSGIDERIWCDLVTIDGDTMACRIRTYPVSQIQTLSLDQTFPLDAIEDWQVDPGDGTIRGSFGYRLMLEQCRRQYDGAVPPGISKYAARYVDLKLT